MITIFPYIYIYILYLFPLYLSEESYKSGKNKLLLNNYCSRCKILTRSFNNWLDKTSRGKFEGGDAAWEEKKLSSYGRSEIRLVEIQENLCSELDTYDQVKCYAIVETAENFIEEWWTLEHQGSSDLYSWLCIEKLKYCCPINHYGDECLPCMLNKNDEVCNNHGKCYGEGTRLGNGSCLCDKGYIGAMCEKCDVNYFFDSLDKCVPCDKACHGCHGQGRSACVKCAKGWEIHLSICTDINECINERNSICNSNEFCVNTEGSYTCNPCHKNCKTCNGPESTACDSCYLNHLFLFGKCFDEKEQQHILYELSLRGLLYIGIVTISVMTFKKSICLTSVFIISTTLFFIFFETYNERSIFHVFK